MVATWLLRLLRRGWLLHPKYVRTYPLQQLPKLCASCHSISLKPMLTTRAPPRIRQSSGKCARYGAACRARATCASGLRSHPLSSTLILTMGSSASAAATRAAGATCLGLALQHGRNALALSGPCGHPQLQKPARLLGAAVWAQGGSPRRSDARRRPRQRFDAFPKSPKPPHLTMQALRMTTSTTWKCVSSVRSARTRTSFFAYYLTRISSAISNALALTN